MNILTPTGYRSANDLVVGDEVTAFDMVTGAPLVNHVVHIEWMPVAWDAGVFVTINGAFTLFQNQSVWANGNVTHASLLQPGDVIYDDTDRDVTVTSVAVTMGLGWWRLEIDGDHSYIADGLTLHNASRFLVGGTCNLDGSTTTHIAASSNGAGGASYPTISDAFGFDANSGGGTATLTATLSCLSFSNTSGTTSLALGAQTFNCNSGGSNAFIWSDNASKTLDLGSGTVNCTVWTNNCNPARFTCGTSTINVSGSNKTFTGGGCTYATVVFKDPNATINEADTFANLTHQPTTPAVAGSLTLKGNITVTTLFTLDSGATAANRILVCSNTTGTQRTITSASNSFNNADFQDIVGAGAASWSLAAITGLSGDCGNNSGITFTTPTTQHWITAAGGNTSAVANWTSRVPLPQDTVKFDCAFGSNKTVNGDTPRLGKDIDWTGATWTGTLTFSTNFITYFGSFTGISGLSLSGSTLICINYGGTLTFTGNGASFGIGLTWTQFSGGSVTLGSALVATSAGDVTVNGGSFSVSASSYAVTANSLNFLGTVSATLGTATHTLLASSLPLQWSATTTFTDNTWTLKFTNSTNNAMNMSGGGSGAPVNGWGTLWFARGASTGTITLPTGAQTYSDIKDTGTAAHSIVHPNVVTTLRPGATYGVSGADSSNHITLSRTGASGQFILSAPAGVLINLSHVTIANSVAIGGAIWQAFTAANDNTNNGNNGGWRFNDVPPFYEREPALAYMRA